MVRTLVCGLLSAKFCKRQYSVFVKMHKPQCCCRPQPLVKRDSFPLHETDERRVTGEQAARYVRLALSDEEQWRLCDPSRLISR